MPHKETALITGGAGFLGSHICDRLIEQGKKVVCVDNLITGHKDNIKHLFDHPDFTHINHDISKELRIPGEINYVLHFASPASPVDYLKHPIPTLKVGSRGTHHALGIAKAKKARFLLASTSEVYGDPLEHPQTESYWGNVNPIGPRGVYDEAKRFAEAITLAYHRSHNINTKIVRIFNTYGPRMRINDGRVVPNFIYQALHNEPITVYGDGSQTRSFCYMDDLISGILKLLFSDETGPINIGNPREFTIKEFAELVVEMSGSKSEITFKPLPKDDPKQRRPDITLANTKLGWEPNVMLEDGLKQTIEWFKVNKFNQAQEKKETV